MDKINIKLIVGLGNPGKKYENTRHNMGFLTIDNLQLTIDNCSNWKLDKRINALTSSCQEETMSNVKCQMSKVILIKPQTFINNSGTAVLALAKKEKIKPENILIVHDDVDILWGKFKFSFGSSSAGHKGVESIIKALKTKNFWRLRIGIQPTPKKHTPADKIILKKFTPSELKTLDQTIKKVGLAI